MQLFDFLTSDKNCPQGASASASAKVKKNIFLRSFLVSMQPQVSVSATLPNQYILHLVMVSRSDLELN